MTTNYYWPKARNGEEGAEAVKDHADTLEGMEQSQIETRLVDHRDKVVF